MTRYACTNHGCPTRESVTAASPPTCYTCARPMTAVREVRPGWGESVLARAQSVIRASSFGDGADGPATLHAEAVDGVSALCSWQTTGRFTASGGTGGGGGSGNAIAVSSTRASSNAWPAHACGITSANATGYARNVNGVIIDRGYCEPSGERDLVTAWKCSRCHWATHLYSPKNECIKVPVHCDAPARQVRVPIEV